jgi:carboxypeptidase C (cathepsin A)
MVKSLRSSRRVRLTGALVAMVVAVSFQQGNAADLAASSSSETVSAPASGASTPVATNPRESGSVANPAQPEKAGSETTRSGRAKSTNPSEPAQAAEHGSGDEAHEGGAKPGPGIPVPPETSSATRHTIVLDGRKIAYTATAGNLLLHNDAGEPTASVFYVAYTADSKTPSSRPVTFLFNGGPGAGTVFLLMGSVGPKRVHTASPGITPPAPYALEDNPDSLLDKTDLVFIDAVGAGFSRIVGHATPKNFYGVDPDLSAFAQFIDRYLTINQRWNSPKYLFGESYGTTRAAMLAYRLTDDGIALNGVVLMSSVLNYAHFAPGLDIRTESYLPTYAAIAWYHNKISPKPASLAAWVEEARGFARGPLAAALAQGDALPDSERDAIAAQIAHYTGLNAQYVKDAQLRVGPGRFRKELLRSESRTLGRYDARFEGIDYDNAGETPDYDASVTSVANSFTGALHQYLAQELHYTPAADRYRVFNGQAGKDWDMKHREPWGDELPVPYAAGDLSVVMRQNPQLRVLSLNGYYDLATPFYATEYDLAHMQLDPSLRGNLRLAYYPTGHMIYLDDGALHSMKGDLDRFYGDVSR